MNRNLFFMELKVNRLSLVLWMIIITILISLTMSVYPTFLENQSKIMDMMNLVPKGALQFKGISNFNDLLSILGFYAANNTIYMMVLGSIFAIVLSSNILLKEEYNKTAEYLMTRPLSRKEIFISKLLVVFLHVFLLNLITMLSSLICLEIFKNGPFSIKAFIILSIYTLMLNVLFAAIGIVLSTLVKRPKPITTFTIGIVLIFYFIYTLSKISGSASGIGYLSPFKYVNVDVINPAYKLSIWNISYFIGISFLLIGISYQLYKRKDIYT